MELKDELGVAQSEACGKFRYVDMLSLLEPLSAKEFMCLVCIEKVRCKCRVSGRKWLAVLVVMHKHTGMGVRGAFDFVKWLYGTEWNKVEFDYYNATRNYSGKQKIPSAYLGVDRKYLEIEQELDALLGEIAPFGSDKSKWFGGK